jgi:hypothetical protein
LGCSIITGSLRVFDQGTGALTVNYNDNSCTTMVSTSFNLYNQCYASNGVDEQCVPYGSMIHLDSQGFLYPISQQTDIPLETPNFSSGSFNNVLCPENTILIYVSSEITGLSTNVGQTLSSKTFFVCYFPIGNNFGWYKLVGSSSTNPTIQPEGVTSGSCLSTNTYPTNGLYIQIPGSSYGVDVNINSPTVKICGFNYPYPSGTEVWGSIFKLSNGFIYTWSIGDITNGGKLLNIVQNSVNNGQKINLYIGIIDSVIDIEINGGEQYTNMIPVQNYNSYSQTNNLGGVQNM